MPLILPGNVASATAATGYDVANSCRVDTAATTYMTKAAFSNTGTNAFKFTFSCWIKRANLGVDQRLLTAGDSTRDGFTFNTSDQLQFFAGSNSSEVNPFVTNRQFRDVSAWYHIVIACDSELSGATNQTKFYVNGTLETSFSATAAVDDENTWHIGNAKIHRIGADSDGSLDNYLDGYLAEVVLIDGQQLAADQFGEFDSDSPNIWKPIDVSGLTFGTNGFYLDFEDSGNLGDDESGNTHDFAETNLAAVDQATDTPTNNFATLNPLNVNAGGVPTFAEGNLDVTVNGGSGTQWGGASTIGVTAGKWYAECKIKVVDNTVVGVDAAASKNAEDDVFPGQQNESVGILVSNGYKYIDDSGATHGAALSADDILMIALDLTNENVYFGKNGQWFDGSGNADEASPNSAIGLEGADHSSAKDGAYFFAFGDSGGSSAGRVQWNFGNPPYANSSDAADANGYGAFEYAPPSGYFALCTKNLATYG